MNSNKDYTHKTLKEKLGLKVGDHILTVRAPKRYETLIGGWPEGSVVNKALNHFDFIHVFVISREELEEELPLLKSQLQQNGMIWVSNPKGKKEFNQNDVMEIGLRYGLVDVKVASFDEYWSAMKFVVRLKDRHG